MDGTMRGILAELRDAWDLYLLVGNPDDAVRMASHVGSLLDLAQGQDELLRDAARIMEDQARRVERLVREPRGAL